MRSIKTACLQLQAGLQTAAAKTKNFNYFICLIRIMSTK
jgi:hypothetical protein